MHKHWKTYFGSKPLINILTSEFLFWAIGHRKRFLLQKNHRLRGVASGVSILNATEARTRIDDYMKQGYCKLNLGGGRKNLAGFVNIDFVQHPDVERQIAANILDLSFIPSSTMSHVHANHVIEHLTPEQMVSHLDQCNRILIDDGIVTIRCPNLLGVCFGFFFGGVPEDGREEFIAAGYPQDEEFHNPRDSWYEYDVYGLCHWIYGDMGNIANQHLNQVTPTMLRTALARAGFDVLIMTAPETVIIVVVARKTVRAPRH